MEKTTLCLSCFLHCQLMLSAAHISLLLNLAMTVTARRSLPIWTGGYNCTGVAPDSSTRRDLHLGLHGKGRTWCSSPTLSFKATWGVPWLETINLSLWAIVHADGWGMLALFLMRGEQIDLESMMTLSLFWSTSRIHYISSILCKDFSVFY